MKAAQRGRQRKEKVAKRGRQHEEKAAAGKKEAAQKGNCQIEGCSTKS